MNDIFLLWYFNVGEYTGENPSHLILVCSRWESSLLQPTWQYNLPSQYQKCYIIFLYRVIHSPRTECAIAVFHRHATVTHVIFWKISWESLARFRNARERESERESEGKKTFRIFFFLYSLVAIDGPYVIWLYVVIGIMDSRSGLTGANNSFVLSFRIRIVKYSSKEIIISCSRFSFSFILWALKSSTYSVWR